MLNASELLLSYIKQRWGLGGQKEDEEETMARASQLPWLPAQPCLCTDG